ncbi:MAG: hypothetical protein GX595_10735 [Lentisphaerae bacterium]|nr:hypothetical protein [Lentisphaerota bacterium]
MIRTESTILLMALAVLCVCTGCSTSSLFVSYPKQINPLLQDVRQGRALAPEAIPAGRIESADRVLYLAERGRLQQVQGNHQGSIVDYREAIAAVAAAEQAADVTVRGAGAQLGAVVVNDNVLPYRAASYERVLLHHLQALNYLMAGDTQAAAVEVRRAEFEQRQALDRHGREIAEARAEASRNRLDLGQAEQRLNQAYAGLDEVAGKVKNSFQNAATFFVSGVIYELVGQPNDAYIDYKKALEIMPGNAVLQQDVLRLARVTGITDDIESLRARHPTADLPPVPAGSGSLVVLVDDEFVPQKQSFKIPLPIISAGRYVGMVALAFPFYESAWHAPTPYAVEINGSRRGATEVVCSTRALAARALRERLPAMLLRQGARAAAKGIMAKELTDNFGPAAAFATTILNYATEQADLRSWSSLPDNVQIARHVVAAGSARVALSHGSGPRVTVTVPVTDGGVTILYARRAGGTLYVQPAAFGPGGVPLAAAGT